MNQAFCPKCCTYVYADWFKTPEGKAFALCTNHGSKIVHCEIVEKQNREDSK